MENVRKQNIVEKKNKREIWNQENNFWSECIIFLLIYILLAYYLYTMHKIQVPKSEPSASILLYGMPYAFWLCRCVPALHLIMIRFCFSTDEYKLWQMRFF